MQKRAFPFLLIVTVCCVGCGGGGSTPQVANPFAGSYLGEYVDQNDKAGQFQLVVASSGAVSGQYYTVTGTLSSVRGSIDKDGHGSMSYAGGTADIQMDTSIVQTNRLNIIPNNTTVPSAIVVLATNPTSTLPSGNPYEGNYTAILRDTTAGTNGAISLTVSQTGVVWGDEAFNSRGDFSTYTVNGTVSDSGALNVTILEQKLSVIGTLNKGNAYWANVQFGNGDVGTLTLYSTGSTFGPPPPVK